MDLEVGLQAGLIQPQTDRVEQVAGGKARRRPVTAEPFVGQATVEMEALDSVSSQQVAAYIETRVGKKYHWTKGVKTGVSDYMKAYSTWEYTKQSFDVWAKLIRERLDAAHAEAATPE